MRILTGKFKFKEIQTLPNDEITRPTTSMVRQAFFNIVQNQIEEGVVLDLFSGSGAMGLEALSRGAQHVTFIEKEDAARALIQKNLQAFTVTEQAEVIQLDLLGDLKLLAKLKKERGYNLVYIDPPYRLYREAPKSIVNLLEALLEYNLLEKEVRVFFETDLPNPMEEIVSSKWKAVPSRRYANCYLLEYTLV